MWPDLHDLNVGCKSGDEREGNCNKYNYTRNKVTDVFIQLIITIDKISKMTCLMKCKMTVWLFCAVQITRVILDAMK